ncbi:MULTISPECIES: pseudaminic acid cytidylyltransferase [unclassified Moraxella]|uniref:pseudaminic acid cytidylyltransferase n=1 Tax=unclassified Moraxella TaxID=2685852 RepID=UPI003AF8CB9A
MNICIIPARGGSKRIPRKNIKDFCGKPMLARAIETAKHSQLFEKIIVSTDDGEIAEIARQHGAEVIDRPVELANDYATTVAVIRHAVQDFAEKVNVCCLYPCTPLLTSNALTESFDIWQKSTSLYCFPVLEFESNILRSLKMDTENQLTSVFSQNEQVRTQDLPHAYYDAGQFYWGSRQAWLTEERIHSHATGFVLPKYSVVDIDDESDWQFAEQLFGLKQLTLATSINL